MYHFTYILNNNLTFLGICKLNDVLSYGFPFVQIKEIQLWFSANITFLFKENKHLDFLLGCLVFLKQDSADWQKLNGNQIAEAILL